MAYSLRTALAFCSPRPWAPSAAAVRTLRTGSALLSGKCRQGTWSPFLPAPLPSLLAGPTYNPARASRSWDPGSVALLPK